MSSFNVKLNREGVREMLRSDEMMAICKQHADDTLAGLGMGYEVSTYKGRNRVNASVTAVTHAAKRDNLKNNSILKALK